MDFRDGVRQLGVELDAAQVTAFELYRAELIDWNQRFNLTSIADPGEIEVKHFLDSLSCLLGLETLNGRPLDAWLASAPAAVDVGAGAGFPGLRLKIVWPGLRLTLLESTQKKCRFLAHMVTVLGLRDVTIVQARAEDFGRGAGRAAFDLALVRALALLPTLLEYTLPLLRNGGWLIAQKGREPREELAASQTALDTLGGRLVASLPVIVPSLKAERTLVLVKKARSTPAAYPRQAGTPKREPLGS